MRIKKLLMVKNWCFFWLLNFNWGLDVMAATQIEALPSKIQNKLFYVGLGLIPVAFIYVGLHFLSGSQEARMKLTGVIIGAVLILGATAIVATLKSVIGQ